MDRKKLLLIGISSKVGSKFLEMFGNEYDVVGTHHHSVTNSIGSIELDLNSASSVDAFISEILHKEFDSVLFLSGLYQKDDDLKDPLEMISVNTVAFHKILKSIRIKNNGKVIFFTDAGTILPKEGYSLYTMAKDMLKSYVRAFAIEMKHTCVLGIDMGPVITVKSGKEEESFYKRSPMPHVKKPIDGLCGLLHFIINEENYYSTGAIIDFSGGSYLVRNTQHAR